MPTFSGTWIAKVREEFEVEAENEDEARKLAEELMELHNVTELIDMEIEHLDEDEDLNPGLLDDILSGAYGTAEAPVPGSLLADVVDGLRREED